MLSDECNASERWRTTIGLISKKSNFARAAHFFVHFFAVVLYDYNVQLPETSDIRYTFYGGNVVRVLVHFFFTDAHFHLALVAASISHFVTAARKFSCCQFRQKNVSFHQLLSLALDLCRPFSCWASLACRLLSLFLCLSPALHSKFVDMTINLS